jgi:hypothetical protein
MSIAGARSRGGVAHRELYPHHLGADRDRIVDDRDRRLRPAEDLGHVGRLGTWASEA